MSAADFSTELTAYGTKKEYLKILEFFRRYSDERQARYRANHDCWYLDKWGDEIGEVTEDKLENYVKDGVFSIGFAGPYGIIPGPITEVIDLFERLADAVPTCSCFKGEISGFDSWGDQKLRAKFENGLLYLRSFLKAEDEGYEDEDYDEDDEDEWDEYDEEDDDEDGEDGLDEYDEEDDDSDTGEWDTIYDPIKHEYRDFPKYNDPKDTVTVTILLTDSTEKTYELMLPSQNIKRPTNFTCYPEQLLEADSVEKLIQTLTENIEGDGDVLRKKDLAVFGEKLRAELGDATFAKLELTKIHDHKAPFFFGWLKSSVLGNSCNLKKKAKKAITCAKKNRQKKLDAFETYLAQFEPSFPGCEYTGWPEFCRGEQCKTSFDWHGIADTVEGFARFICAKKEPREYTVEKVTIDYRTGSIERTATYMPGGPISDAVRD